MKVSVFEAPWYSAMKIWFKQLFYDSRGINRISLSSASPAAYGPWSQSLPVQKPISGLRHIMQLEKKQLSTVWVMIELI